jgi:glycerate dehydrogenase
MSKKIVFLDSRTVSRGPDDIDLSALEKLGEVTVYPLTKPRDTLARIRGAEIVITNKVLLKAETLAAAAQSGLKLVALTATGTNNVDLPAAREAGVQVRNVAGYSTRGVAQHTLALLLTLAGQLHRYLPEKADWAKSPMFTRLDYPTFEVAGKTLGLLGTGSIGGEFGKLAEAMGMRILAWDRTGEGGQTEQGWPRLPLLDLLPECDVVSLHCQLSEQTVKIINAKTLSEFKPKAILLNTGRGPLIDEPALAEALKSGQLGGAGLDVLSVEPPPKDHPLLDPAIPNLIITPHTAWIARESRKRCMRGVYENIQAYLRGEDTNRVA